MGESEEGSGEGRGREEVKRMGGRWWLVIESRDIRLHGLLTSATMVRVDPVVAEASPFLRTYLPSRRVHNSVCILYKWLFTDRVWM